MTTKQCRACGETKPLDAFNKNARNKTNGRQSKCKPCEKLYEAEWRKANPRRVSDRTASDNPLAEWSNASRAKFWSKVEKTDGCWNWRGSLTTKGYGQFGHRIVGLTSRAHKLAWESEYGAVPDGLVLDHLCRNRSCVRPSHLESVSNQVNVIRGVESRVLTNG